MADLVFIHGAGSSADFWQGQRAAFTRARYLNLSQHGDTLDRDGSHEAPAPSISLYADGIIAYIEEQGLQNVVLNGHSMGGAVALEAALRRPTWLRGLALTCSGARFKVSSKLFELLRSDFSAGVDFILDHSFSTPEGELSYRQRAVRYGTKRQMLRVPPAVVLGDYEACRAFDVSERLAEINVPTLIIAGQSDSMTALELSEELHAGIRGSEMVMIEGAGHMVPLEKTDEYNKVVSEFVERLEQLLPARLAMCADSNRNIPYEGYIPVDGGELYYRQVGHGQPIIVLHGGPDLDHTYLLPDMDRLADSYRLIYHDQRGRGRSAPETQLDSVTIESEIADMEALRKHLQLDAVALLGHSWGGLLGIEYAIRHPEHASHLILMNSVPPSHEGFLAVQREVRARKSAYRERLSAILSDSDYQEGDPDAVANYYRIHFGITIKKAEHLNTIIRGMRPSFTKEGIVRARAIEERLYRQTWQRSEFDLFPGLAQLNTPTLVIHGDYDFIPWEWAAEMAEAIPGASFVLLEDCGHFSYMEAPDEVRKALAGFFAE